MKRILIFCIFSLLALGCGGGGERPAAPAEETGKTDAAAERKTDDRLTVASHSAEKSPPARPGADPARKNAPRRSSPMERAVDVSKETDVIEKARAEYKKKPDDSAAREMLAAAYFERAFALTKAAQYRAALGDFRKGLKLDPDDEPARKMHDEIIRIFRSIGRQPPKEGEEPPPLPVGAKS